MTERWIQRFENFEKAFTLLKENADYGFKELSELERMGCIQAFEITFELSWKVMKDYLIYSGIELLEITPRNVIKEAFGANLITDSEIWLDMLKNRNLTTHTYDAAHIQDGLDMIANNYLPHIAALYSYLKEQSHDH